MPRGVKIERPPPAESVEVKLFFIIFLSSWFIALDLTVICVRDVYQSMSCLMCVSAHIHQ